MLKCCRYHDLVKARPHGQNCGFNWKFLWWKQSLKFCALHLDSLSAAVPIPSGDQPSYVASSLLCRTRTPLQTLSPLYMPGAAATPTTSRGRTCPTCRQGKGYNVRYESWDDLSVDCQGVIEERPDASDQFSTSSSSSTKGSCFPGSAMSSPPALKTVSLV